MVVEHRGGPPPLSVSILVSVCHSGKTVQYWPKSLHDHVDILSYLCMCNSLSRVHACEHNHHAITISKLTATSLSVVGRQREERACLI